MASSDLAKTKQRIEEEKMQVQVEWWSAASRFCSRSRRSPTERGSWRPKKPAEAERYRMERLAEAER